MTGVLRAETLSESVFRVYDFPFRLLSNDHDASRLMRNLYGPFLQPASEENALHAVIEAEAGGKYRWQFGPAGGTAPDLHAALWSLEAALCETVIRSQHGRIAVHGVAVYAGQTLAVIAGCSGAGKSTLSLALAKRGLGVATDDVALVDAKTLDVLAIPRYFHLDDKSVGLLNADGFQFPVAWKHHRHISPADLGAPKAQLLPASALIFMSSARQEHPQITPVSQAQMVAYLLSETGQGPLSNVETIAVLTRMVSGAACYALTPGPLTATADLVADVVLGVNGGDPSIC